jgi:hypothetical protein
MIAVSQAISHVLSLLIIECLCHSQSRIVHLTVMPLLGKLLIILHLEFHDLLRFGLGVINFLKGSLFLHLQHLDSVSQQFHILLDGFSHLLHLWVRKIWIFLQLDNKGSLARYGTFRFHIKPSCH